MKRELIYLFDQAFIITLLFITGLVFERLVEEISIRWGREVLGSHLKKSAKGSLSRNTWRLILAYPTGLALWALVGYMLLVLGFPFGRITILLAYILIFSVLYFFYIDTRKNFTIDSKRMAELLLPVIIVFFVAFLCCSGIFGISISNDSYYYYSVYPQTLVLEQGYVHSFDVFLTDVGQTTAVICTLPWFFGFEETFGIQIFLGFNLVAIFAVSIYEMGMVKMPGKADIGIGKRKIATAVAVGSSVALVFSSPFYVMTRWVLANVYFMTYFFIAFVLTIKQSGKEYILGRRDRILTALYVATLSMLRMEGGMFAGLLILCACTLNLKNRILLKYYAIPVALMHILYDINTYLILRVDPLYSFMSRTNMVVMLLYIAVIIIYLVFIRGKRLLFIQKHYTAFLMGGLVGINVLLAIVSPERYLGNLKFFAINITHQNGWGVFGVFLPVSLLLMPVGEDLKKKINFPVLFTMGYVLFTIALCWARDGTLRDGIGDSGNRVLLQIVPFVIYTLVELLVERTGLQQEPEK